MVYDTAYMRLIPAHLTKPRPPGGIPTFKLIHQICWFDVWTWDIRIFFKSLDFAIEYHNWIIYIRNKMYELFKKYYTAH